MSTTPVLRFRCLDCSTDTDHAKRVARAETEPMLAVPRVDRMHRATGIYDVFSASGQRYTVDLGERGRCTCPDTEYQIPECDAVACKHWLRVLLLIRRTAMPAPDAHVPPCVREALVGVLDAVLMPEASATLLDRTGGELDPMLAAVDRLPMV